MELTETIFPDKLDLDSSEQAIQGMRYLLNCRQFSSTDSEVGVITKIKGTTLVSIALPGGTNKCIGAYDDDTNKTVIYLVWNSAGNHGIYRYYVSLNTIEKVYQSKFLNFSKDGLVSSMNLVGDLFFWTQGDNPQRKINISKANNTNKASVTNIYLKPLISQVSGNFILKNGSFTNTVFITFIPPSPQKREDVIAFILNKLNGWKTFVTLENEGTYIKVTGNGLWTVTFQPFAGSEASAIWTVGQNYYEGDYEQYFDAVKYPSWLPPQASLFRDTSKSINYIRGNTFQFRTRYIFDDNEEGTWSAYSNIALDKYVTGNDPLKTLKNGIAIDYSDNGRLFTTPYRNQIKRVEISFRTSSTARDKLIVALEQYDLEGTYKFYNDGNYTEIDPAESGLNATGLPITSGAQEYFESAQGGGGRLFYADNLSGYPKIPIDAKINVSFNDSPQKKLCTISGYCTILNAIGKITSSTHISEQIYKDGDNYWFGNSDSAKAGRAHQALDKTTQGFVFYLAGTPYYGIANYSSQASTSPHSSYPNRANPFSYGIYTLQFSIPNVPPGKYLLRCASHLCKDGSGDIFDLSNESLSWQSTSTAIIDFCGYSSGCDSDPANSFVQEMEIVVQEGTTSIDISQPNQPYDVFGRFGNTLPNGGLTVIADLTSHSNRTAGSAGYLVQAETNDETGAIVGKRVAYQGIIPDWGTISINGVASHFTDHNGYFWITAQYGAAFSVIPAPVVKLAGNVGGTLYNKSSGTTVWTGDFNGVAKTALSVYDGIISVLVPVSEINTANGLRAKVIGTVINSLNNEPVGNVPVVIDKAGQGFTDDNGQFSIFVYKNAIDSSYDQSLSGGTTTTDPTEILVNGNAFVLKLSEQYYGYSTATGRLYFNNENDHRDHDTGNIIISYVALIVTALKRGETVQYGIIYGDRGNRTSPLLTDERFRFYIPMTGEELSQYFPDTYSTATYKFGQPVLSWEINHRPPSWAKWWAWVRTPRKLEWIQAPVSGVEYVKFWDSTSSVTDIPAANKGFYGGSGVTQVFLDLSTFSYYKKQHSQSLLGYEWSKGDRMRLIMNDSGDFFQWGSGTYDVEILGMYGFKIIIPYFQNMPELKEGAVIEIYRVTDTGDLKYYEVGEFFEVVNGYHTKDQTSIQPATGVFTNGDAFVRQRSMMVEDFNTGANAVQKIVTFYCEDPAASDFYVPERQTNDIGRIQVYDPEQRDLQRIANICFTDRFVEGSFINGLNLVQPLNNEDTNNAFGRIRRLKTSGNVMLAIHERETVSLYIGQTVAVDAQTNANVVALSDKVIGTIVPLLGGFGTRHPESVDTYNGDTFWWDDNKSTVVMYSGNGLHPIGDEYSVSSFLKTMKDIPQVIGWCDQKKGEYTVFFKKKNTAPSPFDLNSIAFTFRKKGDRVGFTHWTNYNNAEMIGHCSLQSVGFKNGQLYTLETGDYCNFFGIKYPAQAKFVAKQLPATDKTWMSLAYKSNSTWSATIENNKGQQSSLMTSDFEFGNDVWWAAFLRDENTPNVDNPATQGDFLQSETLSILLENNDEENALLYWVHVTSNVNDFTVK